MAITPYRQPIRPHDSGTDVHATKRALRAMGHRGLGTNPRYAGHGWETAIRAVQHQHGLVSDGIYGQRTHEIVARHFDGYAVWLYRHARIRRLHSSPYVNPFRDAVVEVNRVDAGCDYHGRGPIGAVGDAVIYGAGTGSWTGWPGGTYIFYRLTAGSLAGRFVYVAEGVNPLVRPGQRVRAGEHVAAFRWDSAPGMYPGIETGWASSVANVTYADATHEPSDWARDNTYAGLCFARFLHSVGAPAPSVGPGPLFP